MIRTAFSSHSRCFVCHAKSCNKTLRKLENHSIVEAYVKHKILIKNHARCCNVHLDLNGLLLSDVFTTLKTKLINYDKSLISLLNGLSTNLQKTFSTVFEPFNNMSTLSEEHCYNVTKWKKKDFIRFASFITSIKYSTGRSKEQLIAIYRYWLFKGVDQDTLAFLKNDDQPSISAYLAQIRNAINQDFVPYYLGVKSRNRSFFCLRNTEICRSLHNLDANSLALVLDGSYIRIEKSRNNVFQYRSYSVQKKDNLLKPFLIVTPDGYIVDCYGPYEANKNDSTIFEHIIKTDIEFNNILDGFEPKTIFFLDRGISNIFDFFYLKRNFYFQI